MPRASSDRYRSFGGSRAQVAVGDSFVMGVLDRSHLYRAVVVRTDASVGSAQGLNLVYVVDRVQTAEPLLASDIRWSELPVPPLLTNRLGWSRGAFMTVGVVDLGDVADVPDRHCFDQGQYVDPRFVDEYGCVYEEAPGPCAPYALSGYESVIEKAVAALG